MRVKTKVKLKKCKYCKKPVPYNTNQGPAYYHKFRKYCSRQCAGADLENGSKRAIPHPKKLRKCKNCGKVIKKDKNMRWSLYLNVHACSNECRGILLKSKNSPYPKRKKETTKRKPYKKRVNANKTS